MTFFSQNSDNPILRGFEIPLGNPDYVIWLYNESVYSLYIKRKYWPNAKISIRYEVFHNVFREDQHFRSVQGSLPVISDCENSRYRYCLEQARLLKFEF